mmetsp:Transcript_68778/g.201423  ORF Transcript_68778/g.201423 Transcript_68778/m.201423 type:complete len:317 (+) Transcript_68778:1177-2127(+)
MNQNWCPLDRLEGVGLQSIHHEHRECSGNPEVIRRNRYTFLGIAANHPAKACAKILQVSCEGEYGHDFGTHRDGKRRFTAQLLLEPLGILARTVSNRHLPQVLVIAVRHTSPGDRVGINVQHAETLDLVRREAVWVILFVPQTKLFKARVHCWLKGPLPCLVLWAKSLEHALSSRRVLVVIARINCSGKQIVRSRDCVNVAGHVQVELFHWNTLRIAATCRTTFDAESRAHGGLADASEDLVPKVGTESLRQTHRCRRLALTEWRGVYTADDNVMSIRLVLEAVIHTQAELALVWSKREYIPFLQPESFAEHILHR